MFNRMKSDVADRVAYLEEKRIDDIHKRVELSRLLWNLEVRVAELEAVAAPRCSKCKQVLKGARG